MRTAFNGEKCRIVTVCGKVVCEFIDGKAEVDGDTAELLEKLGYEIEPPSEKGVDGIDADAAPESKSSGNIGRRGGRTSGNGKKRN